ncbi:MAG TPA: hypothetical protein VKM54_17730 [Myxococcota bacterium]|nr:hypothetical protein [Myxococcota bacterium]
MFRTCESQGLLFELPFAQVENLARLARDPSGSGEVTDVDLDLGPATVGRALHLAVGHQPFDRLVMRMATLRTPNLILAG